MKKNIVLLSLLILTKGYAAELNNDSDGGFSEEELEQELLIEKPYAINPETNMIDIVDEDFYPPFHRIIGRINNKMYDLQNTFDFEVPQDETFRGRPEPNGGDRHDVMIMVDNGHYDSFRRALLECRLEDFYYQDQMERTLLDVVAEKQEINDIERVLQRMEICLRNKYEELERENPISDDEENDQ